MLIIISCIILIIIGAIAYHFQWKFAFWEWVSVFALAIGVTGSIVNLIIVSVFQLNADVFYENKLLEKQMLEYRLEKQDDIIGNEMLYSQIVEFNNELRYTKKWASNLWTNWFVNQKIANNIDYIDVNIENNE